MEIDELRRRVESFDRWHYAIKLAEGVVTPVAHPREQVRHRHRRSHFFDPMVRLLGGTLEGMRVLDLGCNAGFWSLTARRNGADFVLGVDGRQMHVDQSNLVFEAKGVGRNKYEFVCANLFDMDFSSYGRFDVVLCLGLMYHVAKPVELLEVISAVNSDVLIIDTDVSTAEGSWLELWRDDIESPKDAVDYSLVTVPTVGAVHDIVGTFGYSCVTLKPDFKNAEGKSDYRGSLDYRHGTRRAFICAKESDLTNVDVETEPLGSTAPEAVEARRNALKSEKSKTQPD